MNSPAAEVAPDGKLPAPLAELSDRVEERMIAAPGGKGTEIAVRPREPEPDGAPGLAGRLTGAIAGRRSGSHCGRARR